MRIVMNVYFSKKYTLAGGLASIGASSTPSARLLLRFSWTWVSRSSRSTLSAALTRQASSSRDTRLFREDFLLSVPQNQHKTSNDGAVLMSITKKMDTLKHRTYGKHSRAVLSLALNGSISFPFGCVH